MTLLNHKRHYMLYFFVIQSKDEPNERDIYEELLTHAEIQGNLNKINGMAYVLGIL